MLLIPLINHGPMVLQGLCGCVGIVTFFERVPRNRDSLFCIYTHEGLKGHKGQRGILVGADRCVRPWVSYIAYRL